MRKFLGPARLGCSLAPGNKYQGLILSLTKDELAQIQGRAMSEAVVQTERQTEIQIRPIAGSLGAEVSGVDLSALDAETFAAIHRVLLDHQAIFFHDQDLTPEQFLAFGKRWGGIHFYPYMKGLDGHPEIFELVKEEGQKRVFGNRWHSDQMYIPIPAKATILYAKQVPPVGGDTIFANGYAAYGALSDGMKAMLAGIRSFNNGENKARYGGLSRAEWYKSTGQGGMSDKLHDGGAPDADVVAEHPVIRTHPETGRKALYIGDQTERFAGMTLEESKPLLDYLMAHARRPEFTCRFRWRVGSLALWDNRCTMHYAVADYPGQRRVMHRLTIKGDEVPV